MHSLEQFLSLFRFDPSLEGAVGVEREFFLTDAVGTPQPRSPEFLERASPLWTYELSACQVEHRTSPQKSDAALRADLAIGSQFGAKLAASLGLELRAVEVASADMTTAAYPHDARYAGIIKRISSDTLLAACRVAGVHVHYGVRDAAHAIAVHNALAAELPTLAALGDHSGGERLRLYRAMAPASEPPQYHCLYHFYATALEQGFADNPRNCWHLVRISRHGSVEVRVFGMTADVDEIMRWVAEVRRIAGSV